MGEGTTDFTSTRRAEERRDIELSMRRWRGLPMKLAKPKEERQTAIDSRRFFRRKDAEHPPDPPLIEGS